MSSAVKTTIFANGGSQAVRIPKAFRFDADKVSVQPCRGGILLLPVNRKKSLREVFAACDELSECERGFLDERPCNSEPVARELFS